MGIVSLEGLDFFAYHGFYEAERRTGNRYTLNMRAGIDWGDAPEVPLELTVNYERLSQMAAQRMAKPSALLESIAQDLVIQMLDEFPAIQFAEVEIIKHNPPLGQLCREAKIILRKERPV